MSNLPPETKRVLYGNDDEDTLKTMCFLLPAVDIPAALGARIKSTLAAFEDWTLTQVGPQSFSKHGAMSTFESWMDVNVRVGVVRQRPNSKNVPLTQRWKIGR